MKAIKRQLGTKSEAPRRDLRWGKAAIGRLIGRSPREVERLFQEIDPTTQQKDPLGRLMWIDPGSGKLVIDANEFEAFVQTQKAKAQAS